MMRKLWICLVLILCAQFARATLIVSGTSSYGSNNADTNFTLNLPASINIGDLLLTQIHFGSASITISPPSSWTLVRVDSNGSDRQYLYSHIVVSGEVAGAATSWSLSSSVRVAAVMIGVRSNVAGGTTALAMHNANSGTGTALSATSFNASAAGMLLRTYGIDAGNATFTTPAGLTSVATQSSASVANGASLFVANRTLNAAGTTGTDTTTSSHSGNWIAQSLLLTESGGSSCNSSSSGARLDFDVPNLIANKPSGAVRLRAVDNSGNGCTTLFQNTTQSINFWSGYSNPVTGTSAVEVRVGSGAFTSISGNSSSPTAISLTFDANGETTFEVRYQDAGLMALNASFNGGTTGTYAGLVLNGSDAFVSTPAGLCIQSSTPNLNKANYTACSNNYDQCNTFVAAGNPFNLSVSARAWESDNDSDLCANNSVTPNYVQNAIALSALLIAPSSGDAGSINHATIDITSNGTATYNDMTESEVGVFQFIATPPSYFGQTVSAGTSINYGRFIPHHFAVLSGSTLTNRSDINCSASTFTYLGEPLTLNFSLQAQSASNGITQNYVGTFAKFQNISASSTLNLLNNAAIFTTTPRTALTSTLSSTLTPSWVSGTAAINANIVVGKPSTLASYASTSFGIAPQDSDGVTTTGLNLDTSAPADSIFDHVKIGTSTDLLFGRLRLNSASGPSDMDLPIPVVAEYWSGSQFVTNTADSCTAIDGSKAQATALGASTASGNATLSSGQSNTALIIKAPGAGIYGNVNVSLKLTDVTNNYFPWLQFDWDNNSTTADTDPTATASFGAYRGSDRVIFWQETQ